MNRPPLITMLVRTPTVITEAYLPFTNNASRVSETATNFLHQVDLSAALSNTTFKSLITDRSNLLIRDGSATTMPSKIVLDLGNNTLFAYFNGPKSTVTNTTFYLHASAAFAEADSTTAFTNSGITQFLPLDSNSLNAASGTVWDNLGTVTYGSGKFNDAAIFNNTSTSTIQANSQVIGTGDLSVSLCFNIAPGAKSYHDFMMNGRFYLRYVPSVNIHVYNDAANSGIFNMSLNAGTWHHLTVSRKSTGYTTLYVNGTSHSEKYCGVPQVGLMNPMLSNQGDSVGHLNGVLDEVRITNRLTTAGEAIDLYRVLFEPSTFYTLGEIVEVS